MENSERHLGELGDIACTMQGIWCKRHFQHSRPFCPAFNTCCQQKRWKIDGVGEKESCVPTCNDDSYSDVASRHADDATARQA